MLKKIVACTFLTLFALAGSVNCFAADAGPADITITGDPDAKKPKPAVFPHKAHQDKLKCAECHHGMGEDGKQVAYTEGQEIGKCSSCHNKEKLAGKTMGKLKLDTMKGAGHGNCLACHKKLKKENPDLKTIAKCATCHPKKK